MPENETDTVTNIVVPDSAMKAPNPQRQFLIDLSYDFLTDATQGEIIDDGYIVAQDSELICDSFRHAH